MQALPSKCQQLRGGGTLETARQAAHDGGGGEGKELEVPLKGMGSFLFCMSVISPHACSASST